MAMNVGNATEHQAVVCMALDVYAESMDKIATEAEATGMGREAFAFRQVAVAAREARSAFDYENCDFITVSTED